MSPGSTCCSREYLEAIDGADYEQLAGTGHIGLVTRPQDFSKIVWDFVRSHAQSNQAA